MRNDEKRKMCTQYELATMAFGCYVRAYHTHPGLTNENVSRRDEIKKKHKRKTFFAKKFCCFLFTCIEFSRICLRAISRSSRCRSTSNGAIMEREVFVRFSGM